MTVRGQPRVPLAELLLESRPYMQPQELTTALRGVAAGSLKVTVRTLLLQGLRPLLLASLTDLGSQGKGPVNNRDLTCLKIRSKELRSIGSISVSVI